MILLLMVISALFSWAFILSAAFWFIALAFNIATGNKRMKLDRDGVYRESYTSELADKLAGISFILMIGTFVLWVSLVWGPQFM